MHVLSLLYLEKRLTTQMTNLDYRIPQHPLDHHNPHNSIFPLDY